MSELLCTLEGKAPAVSGEKNLRTLLLIEACFMSAQESRVVDFKELSKEYGI